MKNSLEEVNIDFKKLMKKPGNVEDITDQWVNIIKWTEEKRIMNRSLENGDA